MPRNPASSRLYKIEHSGFYQASGILDWLITIFAVFILGYNIWHLGGYHPYAQMVSSWMTGGLLVLHGFWGLSRHNDNIRINPLGLVFIPFLLYIYVSYLFLTPVPWLAKRELIMGCQGMVVFWVILHNLRRKECLWFFLISLVVLAFICVLVAYYQYFTESDWLPMGRKQVDTYDGRASGTFGIPNSLAALLILIIPPLIVIGFAPKKSINLRIVCIYLALMFSGGIIITGSRGGSIGFICALLILPYFVTRQVIDRLKFFFAIIITGVVVFLVVYIFVDTYRQRVDYLVDQRGESSRKILWRASWDIFKKQPLTGSGAASFDHQFEFYRPESLQLRARHTHNDYLNTLSDYGLLGFILLFFPALYLLWRGWSVWRNLPFFARSRESKVRVTPTTKLILGGLLPGVVAFSIHLFVDFHLKILALLLILASIFGLIVKCSSTSDWGLPGKRWGSGLWFVFMLTLGLCLGWEGMKSFKSAERYFEARERLDDYFDNLESMRRDEAYISETIRVFEESTRWDPDNAYAWGDLGMATLQTYYLNPENYKNIGQDAQMKIEKALAITDQVWSFHAYKGLALNLQGRTLDEVRPSFKKAITFGANNADAWYYYGAVLGYNKSARKEAVEALERAIKLDHGHGDAIRLRDKLKSR